MQLMLTLDWVSISASVIALLSLIASVFSAISASKSANVAIAAEERVKAGERAVAIREVMRSAGKIELQGELIKLALEDASRTAIATAEMHGTPEGKRPFLIASIELQEKLAEVKVRTQHGVERELLISLDEDQIELMQLDLDKTLFSLEGETTWANKRADQLAYANRSIGDDLRVAERAENIYVRRNHEGKLG